MKMERLSTRKKDRTQLLLKNILLPVSLAVLIALVVQLIIRSLYAFPVELGSRAMYPTYDKGERLFFIYPELAQLKRNDVLLVTEKLSKARSICRAIALEGDRIELKNGQVFLNGASLLTKVEDLQFPQYMSNRSDMPEMIIRPGHFFCIHDNLKQWHDSRMWGEYHVQAIEGIHIERFYLF